MKNSFLYLITAIAIGFGACTETNPVLQVDGGQLQGVATNTEGVYVYRGIPYAAPPVGSLRWKAPQAVLSWEGVKIAEKFGAPCYQAAHRAGEFYQKEFFFDGDPPYSEDCLCLNVWTPAAGKTGEKLPVALWVHGGAYVAGWGHEPEMDGEAWAKRGVILVTINYRLGIFGFLTHPQLSDESDENVSGNYGTLDQIEALKWVKNNIAQFGGDPANITVFGQRAGANSIKQLVSSPLSKDRVSKAIIMSGGGVSTQPSIMSSPTLNEAEERGKTIMDWGGFEGLPKMRQASSEEIFGALRAYGDSIKQWVRFGPVIDGYVIQKSFNDAAAEGSISDVPYMIGFTMDDIGPLAKTEEIEAFCNLREEQGTKGGCYAYQFARPLPGDEAGAFHSSELWFVFNTLSRSWRPFTQGDYVLSDVMTDAWVNFTKYGHPNGALGGEWTAFTKQNPHFMIFKLDTHGNEASEMGEPLPRSVE
jgi:para-nitrobenzyl esterase